jgi:hypothetical protein
MRAALRIAVLAALPLFAASANDMPAGAEDWHLCATDADCVVVPGICGEAAVNLSAKNVAAHWYRQQKAETKCPSMFWKVNSGKTRCRLQRCEIAV